MSFSLFPKKFVEADGLVFKAAFSSLFNYSENPHTCLFSRALVVLQRGSCPRSTTDVGRIVVGSGVKDRFCCRLDLFNFCFGQGIDGTI